MRAVVVNIPGQPVPKGRPRFTRGGFAYTPDKTRKYEKLVAGLAKTAMAGRPPFGCPIKVMVTAFMKMPQIIDKYIDKYRYLWSESNKNELKLIEGGKNAAIN